MKRGRDGGGREPWEQRHRPDPWEAPPHGDEDAPPLREPEQPDPWERPADPDPWDAPPASGHSGPKSRRRPPAEPEDREPWEGPPEPDPWEQKEGQRPKSGKFRQESRKARPSDRLRRDGEPPPGDGAEAPDPKAAKEARKTGKAKAKAERAGAKLDTARAKLDKQKPVKKPGPVKVAGRAARAGAWSSVHAKISEAEQENVGTEAAHRTELAAEAGARKLSRFVKRRLRTRPARQVAKWARQVAKWDRRTVKATAAHAYRVHTAEHPELTSNPLSRLIQRQKLKRQYAKRARTATIQGAAAAKKTATATERLTVRAVAFVKRHPVGILLVLACLLLIVSLNSCVASLASVGQSLVATTASTYPAEDREILAAEAAYAGMEAELQRYLDTYEQTHSYDEYHYDLDEIKHDPYVLISILAALHHEFTAAEVQGTLEMLFDRQYTLTERVVVETRYDSDDEPYSYYIAYVTLENFDLSRLPVYIMDEEQLSLFAMYTATHGNRPNLFPQGQYPHASTLKEFTDYDVPEAYLEDETFAALLTEAEKYLGYPYVWGGSKPSTSFDCSGFLSWVLTNSGVYDTGRLGATALYNLCTHVSNPRPGDLVFFKRTYETTGVSHCGLYVGDGVMLHCGDPIGYANLDTSYWQSHFFAYGRIPQGGR